MEEKRQVRGVQLRHRRVGHDPVDEEPALARVRREARGRGAGRSPSGARTATPTPRETTPEPSAAPRSSARRRGSARRAQRPPRQQQPGLRACRHGADDSGESSTDCAYKGGTIPSASPTPLRKYPRPRGRRPPPPTHAASRHPEAAPRPQPSCARCRAHGAASRSSAKKRNWVNWVAAKLLSLTSTVSDGRAGSRGPNVRPSTLSSGMPRSSRSSSSSCATLRPRQRRPS